MGLRTGAPAAQGRTGPRPLRRSLLAWPPSSWVDDDDRLRLSANPPPRRSERGKKESATDRRSRRCRRSAAPCWQSSPPPRPIDALTAREPSVERSNESAKVVLVNDDKVEFNSIGMIKAANPGFYKEADTFRSDPMKAMADLLEAMKLHGIADPSAQRDMLSNLFG